MKVSAAFPTALDTPHHVATAERLGYQRAWLYDTPHQSPDVWMILALAAQETERIGLGPGVLVPELRHPMVNAAGAAALAALAPGRVAVAFGTGFAGMRALGRNPVKWSYLQEYVTAFQGLLRGDTVDWQGSRLRMLHPDGHAPARPVEVPVLISALGPKGMGITRDLGAGLFITYGIEVPESVKDFPWVAMPVHGTVLADGERLDSPRVRAAAGPGNALAFHAIYERGGDVAQLPGGAEWLAAIGRTPEAERHLAVHHQHLVSLSSADEEAWQAGSWSAVSMTTVTGTAAQVAEHLSTLARQGVTEIVYQPTGPDIAGELERFANVAGSLGE
ncbi:LLM class flavin-dependent oxidoreductase [Streptomyces sp. NPDC058232]|uniref:LLM class flavin-dependent oxidoreductase n=1 Tax=Streptomyces sp. NPDC058232 TaxID=3346393 RepID=UPI0036E4DE42